MTYEKTPASEIKKIINEIMKLHNIDKTAVKLSCSDRHINITQVKLIMPSIFDGFVNAVKVKFGFYNRNANDAGADYARYTTDLIGWDFIWKKVDTHNVGEIQEFLKQVKDKVSIVIGNKHVMVHDMIHGYQNRCTMQYWNDVTDVARLCAHYDTLYNILSDDVVLELNGENLYIRNKTISELEAS